MVGRRGGVSGVSGWTALAAGVLVPRLRQWWLLADRHGAVDVRRWWAEDLGHRRHDLPSLTYAVVDLVRRDLVRHLAEERVVAPGSAGRSWVRLL
jgi:hypothetical protein